MEDNQIWVVKQRASDSYEGYTDAFETISLHRTEEGARKLSDRYNKDAAVYAISGGAIEDHEADPDAILGAVENWSSELGDDLRQRLAKPGAVMIDVVLDVLAAHHMSYADTKVTSQLLKD